MAVLVSEPFQALKLRNLLSSRSCPVHVHLATETSLPVYKVVFYSPTASPTTSGTNSEHSTTSSGLSNLLTALSYATHLFVVITDVVALCASEPRLISLVKLAVKASSLHHPFPDKLLKALHELQQHRYIAGVMQVQDTFLEHEDVGVPLTPLSVRSTSSSYWESMPVAKTRQQAQQGLDDQLMVGLQQQLQKVVSKSWDQAPQPQVAASTSHRSLGWAQDDSTTSPTASRSWQLQPQAKEFVPASFGLQSWSSPQTPSRDFKSHAADKAYERPTLGLFEATDVAGRGAADTDQGLMAERSALQEQIQKVQYLRHNGSQLTLDTLGKLARKQSLLEQRLQLVEEECQLGPDVDHLLQQCQPSANAKQTRTHDKPPSEKLSLDWGPGADAMDTPTNHDRQQYQPQAYTSIWSNTSTNNDAADAIHSSLQPSPYDAAEIQNWGDVPASNAWDSGATSPYSGYNPPASHPLPSTQAQGVSPWAPGNAQANDDTGFLSGSLEATSPWSNSWRSTPSARPGVWAWGQGDSLDDPPTPARSASSQLNGFAVRGDLLFTDA
eukprot:TRINITY_DN20807_c0_g1_i1.p1 TRINITY_DN20807_c0_g1~~TRINITY_DN20807_c0_g1_i1.p1  ORF type:complete len:633 (+),score=147.39 TRINITY_DN20807_c0_g1_i1:239-1900(+)